jgi:predicted transcriptional regulator
VADIMDAEPVSVPGETTLLAAQDEFFLRYRWSWFPVVDAAGRFLGILRQDQVDESVATGTPALPVSELVADEEAEQYRIGIDQPLEALLGSEGLRSLGALMAVDPEGRLRGVVTVEQVRRALAAVVPAR